MSDQHRAAVSRRISAPASAIFVLITDPTMHVSIDGSRMLQAAPDAQALTAVGDTFTMDMDREPLGDVPMGKYQVLNTVTRLVPDTCLEWTVGLVGQPAFGHFYGYELEPVGDGETLVTSYVDWSGLPDEWRDRVPFPVVPMSMHEQSLENLDRIVTGSNP
jgi:hypothetical protein